MSFRIVKLLDPIQIVNIPSGLVPRGAYDNATDYAVGDSVDYLGSSYVMHVNAASGVLPTDTTKWQVLANKGATGSTGSTGATGSTGTTGSQGVAGNNGTNGQGVPVGGSSGQVLSKSSATDYDTTWSTPLTVSDTAYNATSWNTNTDAPTKNAVRDKIETMDTAIALNTAKVTYPSADATKVGHITVTQAVDLDTIESDTTTNNAKVTNATHTGDVTGSGALTVDKTAITGKSVVTAVGTDYVLISDTSDSGNLKKALASDLTGGGVGIAESLVIAYAVTL